MYILLFQCLSAILQTRDVDSPVLRILKFWEPRTRVPDHIRKNKMYSLIADELVMTSIESPSFVEHLAKNSLNLNYSWILGTKNWLRYVMNGKEKCFQFLRKKYNFFGNKMDLVINCNIFCWKIWRKHPAKKRKD
jgi:hypothetical protein